ncbi:hypothetical protein [Nostoc sp. C117]|uniref:hypothetical protein n=1 Tax=Nostoc sp. C117 TaxID=3349875 RepID=UPI00370D6447
MWAGETPTPQDWVIYFLKVSQVQVNTTKVISDEKNTYVDEFRHFDYAQCIASLNSRPLSWLSVRKASRREVETNGYGNLLLRIHLRHRSMQLRRRSMQQRRRSMQLRRRSMQLRRS